MKKLFGFALGLSAIAVLASCGDNNFGPETITDMIGREVSVECGSYKKAVCIGAGALRLYTYVCDVEKLAGVEDIDNYTLEDRPKMFDGVARPYFIAHKETFKTLPSCGIGGPNNQAAEAEKILACDPDIVISEYEDVALEDALQEHLGIPVITVKYGSKGVFDENITNSLNLLGRIFKTEEKATKLNEYIASEKAAIETRVSNVNIATSPKVYVCGLGNWGTTNHLWTAQNYAPFNVAKINNVVTGLYKDGIQELEDEKFVSLGSKMDKIIIDSAAIKNLTDPSVFETCKAWNDGEVYLQMAYNAYYTNVEIALINTWFNAKVVYPELFNDIDITAKTNEVTKAFLGKELAQEIFAYKNSFGGYQKINTATFFA